MENLPTPNPPMAAERESIAILLELRDRIHKGPLYTVQGSNFRVGKKTRTPAAARFDPFEGARSYSFKYKPPQRSLASFTTRQYRKCNSSEWTPGEANDSCTHAATKFFPDELLDVFDPVQAKKKKPRARAKKPEDEANRLKDMQENEDEENEEGGDDAEGRDPDDEGEEQEDVDDDFEDDDSDMGGDYDAEKYFDDGDNDEGDADGGDDEGGDYE